VLTDTRVFETKVRKQNRELAALQERHSEKKNEMEKLGKDCSNHSTAVLLFGF
jgi:hypothetical protein